MDKININFDENPVLFNKFYQGAKNYPGEDIVKESFIKKGDLVAIIQLPSPNGGGDYLIPIDEFKKHNLDGTSLCQAYQVAPFYDKKVNEDIAKYKPIAGIYVASEDIKVATGNTLANPQYGSGEAIQLIMPHGKAKIQEAYKDIEMKLNHLLIPLDLNNYEHQRHISDEAKEKINEIKELYKDSINAKEGCLNLRNTEIDVKIYNIMKQKNDLHENLYMQIGTINEYSKELNNPIRNIEYMKELKDQIDNLQDDCIEGKLLLQDQIEVVKSDPEPLKTMSDFNKKHLLNAEKYCPEEIKDILNYSKEKMSHLELNLTNEEKSQLNIPEIMPDSKEFIIDENKENRGKEIYEDTTREGDIEDLGYRSRVYTPYAERRPEALLCAFKAKDELNKLMHASNNKEVNEFCSKAIYNLNSDIKKLDEEIKLMTKLYKTNVDYKIKYLKNKIDDPDRYTLKGQVFNDVIIEDSINKINNGVLNLKDNSYLKHEYLKDLSDRIASDTTRDSMKKELLCNLKVMDELNNILTNNKDIKIKEFCEEKSNELYINVKKLEKQIKSSGNDKKSVFDDKINYMKEKVSDLTRYECKNYSLNYVKKENEIKDITKHTIEEMNPLFFKKLKAINQLYNMEIKFSGLRKEAKVEADNKLDQGMIKLQGEKDILKTAKEKLEILDKYKPIVATYNSKKLFKKSYKNKHVSEIQEYNQAKKELESMKIKNWDDYKKAKDVLDKKEKSLVGDKKLPSLKDYKKDIEELRKNKNIQNDIIKEHSNLVKVKLQKLDKGMER